MDQVLVLVNDPGFFTYQNVESELFGSLVQLVQDGLRIYS